MLQVCVEAEPVPVGAGQIILQSEAVWVFVQLVEELDVVSELWVEVPVELWLLLFLPLLLPPPPPIGSSVGKTGSGDPGGTLGICQPSPPYPITTGTVLPPGATMLVVNVDVNDKYWL